VGPRAGARTAAGTLLLSIIPACIVADHGYAIHAFRDLIWNQGARPAIPAKRNEVDVVYPLWIYHNLNRVERLWAQLKEWCAVPATERQPAPSWVCSE